jgi:hypothetical protein
MDKKTFTRILAITGTVFVWTPILAPVFFSLMSIIKDQFFRFDYLMPAEFFPVVLIGGALLLWASIRARSYLKPIGWSLGTAVFMLVAGQVIALATGLASGEMEPTGWWWIVVVGTLLFYTLAVVALAVSGVLLLRRLYRTSQLPQSDKASQ